MKAQHRAVALEAAAELLQSPSMTRHAPDLAHAVLQVRIMDTLYIYALFRATIFDIL